MNSLDNFKLRLEDRIKLTREVAQGERFSLEEAFKAEIRWTEQLEILHLLVECEKLETHTHRHI